MSYRMERLLDEMAELYRAHPAIMNVEPHGDTTLLLTISDKEKMVADLTNLHGLIQDVTAEVREARMREFAQIAAANAETMSQRYTADRLVVIAWPDRWKTRMPFHRQMMPGWQGLLALDSPEALAFIADPESFSEMGLDGEEAAYQRAVQNLRDSAGEPYIAGSGSNRCIGLVSEDSLDASRALFCPDILADAAKATALQPPWVLCVPDRDTAVLTSVADPRQLQRVANLCHQDYRAAHHQLAPLPLHVEQDGTIGPMIDVIGLSE